MEMPTTNEEIRFELAELRTEVKQLRTDQNEIKKTLMEVRDRVISQQQCPRPGLCVELKELQEDAEQRLRSLERRDAYIVGACTIISLLVPVALKFWFKV